MKIIKVILLIIITHINVSIIKAQHVLTINDVTFDTTKCEILKFNNIQEKNIVIPEYLMIEGNSYEIKKIGDWAFYDKGINGVIFDEDTHIKEFGENSFYLNSITNLIIPKSVIVIGDDAFRRNSLINVQFESNSNVSIIGANAFSENKIDSIMIPASVTVIGYEAFYAISLKNICFESNSNLSTIGQAAFAWNKISNIIFPNHIKEIGVEAFLGNSLTEIKLPSSLNNIGGGAFNGNIISKINEMPSNGLIYKRNKDCSVDSSVIVSYGGISDTIDFIPNNVTEIGDYAFSTNGLDSVVIPNGITVIGRGAFSSNFLNSIIIPNSVSVIKESAFYSSSVKKVYFESNSQLKLIEKEAFFFLDFNSIPFPTTSAVSNFKGWKEVNPNNPGTDDGNIYMPGDSFSFFGHAYVAIDEFYTVTINTFLTDLNHKINNCIISLNDKEYSTDFGKLVLFLTPSVYIYSAEANLSNINYKGYKGEGSFEVINNDVVLNVILSKDVGTYIDKRNMNQFVYYPNPASDYVVINLDGSESKLTLYNLLGEKCLEHKISSEQTSIRLVISNFKNGLYLLELGDKRGKLLIKR